MKRATHDMASSTPDLPNPPRDEVTDRASDFARRVTFADPGNEMNFVGHDHVINQDPASFPMRGNQTLPDAVGHPGSRKKVLPFCGLPMQVPGARRRGCRVCVVGAHFPLTLEPPQTHTEKLLLPADGHGRQSSGMIRVKSAPNVSEVAQAKCRTDLTPFRTRRSNFSSDRTRHTGQPTVLIRRGTRPTVATPDGNRQPKAHRSNQPKESDMDNDLELIDLGDAKEETKGTNAQLPREDDESFILGPHP